MLSGDVSVRSDAELSSSNPIFLPLFINSQKKISKNFENKFLKTKLVSSSLRTAVVKLVYFATRFVKYFSHLASENFKIFPQLRLFLFVGPAEPI